MATEAYMIGTLLFVHSENVYWVSIVVYYWDKFAESMSNSQADDEFPMA